MLTDIGTQRIQVGLIHARKAVTVIAKDDSFHLVIDGDTVAVVPRTTTREIHRYKARASRSHPAQPPERR